LVWLRDLTRGQGAPDIGFPFSYPDAAKRALNVVRQGRKGFRLPTVDELASLLYFAPGRAEKLPSGHPFVAVKTGNDGWYWSSTPDPTKEGNVYCVHLGSGEIASMALRDSRGLYTERHYHYHWPVRIGRGVLAGVN
jgi:hypothetical protein